MASPICGMCKSRLGGHNRNAGGSNIEAPKQPKEIVGFVGIFIPVQNPNKTAKTKAASHPQEDFMTSLSRSSQIIPQSLRYTLRWASHFFKEALQ